GRVRCGFLLLLCVRPAGSTLFPYTTLFRSEIAAIITTPDLQEVSSFGPFAIAARQSDLDLMGDYVRDMHTRTGLLDRVTSSAAYSLDTVQDGMASWMQEHGLTERVILAGNSVKLDFDFLRRHMPRVFSR